MRCEQPEMDGLKMGRPEHDWAELLFLFDVPDVFTQARAVFLQTKFFTTGLSLHGVVVIAGFFADQKDGFCFLLAFGHLGTQISMMGATIGSIEPRIIARSVGSVQVEI